MNGFVMQALAIFAGVTLSNRLNGAQLILPGQPQAAIQQAIPAAAPSKYVVNSHAQKNGQTKLVWSDGSITIA